MFHVVHGDRALQAWQGAGCLSPLPRARTHGARRCEVRVELCGPEVRTLLSGDGSRERSAVARVDEELGRSDRIRDYPCSHLSRRSCDHDVRLKADTTAVFSAWLCDLCVDRRVLNRSYTSRMSMSASRPLMGSRPGVGRYSCAM